MHRSFTVLALTACAALSASAAGTKTELRMPHTKDARVYVTLENKSTWFRDVTIGGHKYTVQPGELLAVKAPVGTVVYAASAFGKYHAGDPFMELNKSVDHMRVKLN
jgi:hypothetical protein